MNMLTLNIGISGTENFNKARRRILTKLSGIKGLALNIYSAKAAFNEDYLDLLERTDSKFVTFLTDCDIIEREEIAKLIAALEGEDEQFLIKNVYTAPPESQLQSNIFMYFPAFVFETAALKDVDLSDTPAHLWQEKILLDFTLKYGAPIPLDECNVYTTAPLETNPNLYEPQFEKRWYQEDLEQFYLPYIKEHFVRGFDLQARVFYAVTLRFYLNMNHKDKLVIQGSEITRFFKCCLEITDYIDDEVIADRKNYRPLPVSYTYLFLKKKHNGEVNLDVKRGKNVRYFANGQLLVNNYVKVKILACNTFSGGLRFDCELLGSFFIKNIHTKMRVIINGSRVPYSDLTAYNLSKVCGRSVMKFYQFSFEIPAEDITEGTEIMFKARMKDGTDVTLPLEFPKTSSRLSKNPWSYYIFDQKHTLVREDKKLLILNTQNADIPLREEKIVKEIKNSDIPNCKEIIAYREAYLKTKEKFANRKIWIFFDKLYMGGDNGEYLFRYCHKHAEGVESYYIINKTSKDYKALKREYGDSILEYGTPRQILTAMHSDLVLATHATTWGFCGITNQISPYLRNLLHAKTVCIQHGLTVQDIAQYQNRLADNLSMYFCASQLEIDNLLRPIYGFEESQLKLTGLPRYDGLKSNDKKQILITPTWRRNIVINGNKIGTAKQYNPHFKETEYFRIFNSLINDPKVLKTAEKCGYRLVYLLHPTVSSQVNDFHKNAQVDILTPTNDVSYEKLLRESSLMITDYSGVQFDFAYMKKPLIYYHPEELPPQYEETVYKYKEMGFGPIIKKYKNIVKLLCEYMENGCVMTEEYVKRVDSFFAYTDHSNCQRIYGILKNEFLD